MIKKYSAASIKIYKGLDAVRKRPGMYIGNTDDGSGLHKLIFETLDNSVDESLAGYCSKITVTLYTNNIVSIIDNGRGIPTDLHKDNNKSAAEIIMTVLHSGAKFDDSIYKISGGLHGVGISVVNALSLKLLLQIFKSGFLYEQFYSCGKAISKLKITCHTDLKGTKISFVPDKNIFVRNNIFEYNIISQKLEELSYLNSNILFQLIKKDNNIEYETFYNKNGLLVFIEKLTKNKEVINKEPLHFLSKKNAVKLNLVMQWTESLKEHILCYTNNIYQKDGGSHLIGFKSALTKSFKTYIESQISKKDSIIIQGEDIRSGLTAILSIYMSEPKFSSQTKDKLVSLEAKNTIEAMLFIYFRNLLYDNPNIAKLICNKIISSARLREKIKRIKDLDKKKYTDFYLSEKLSDCQEPYSQESEIFLVEGDSAGGSAKQARNRKNQAILALRGKILNVEKADLNKVLSSSEIVSVINSINCGLNDADYAKEKIRYKKIIFMTDADVDGAHIRTLLMTFFYRKIPKIIENEHIYIARPPLYKITKNKKSFYIKDRDTFQDFLFKYIYKEFILISNLKKYIIKIILKLYKKMDFIVEKYANDYSEEFLHDVIFFSRNNTWNNWLSTLIENFNKYLNNKNSTLIIDSNNKNLIKFITYKYNIKKEHYIDINFFFSHNYRICRAIHKLLTFIYKKNNLLKYKNKNYDYYKFNTLIIDIKNDILKDCTIQRYKGLGEMSPHQLWSTTMNPKTRNLQLLKIKNIDNANKIFTDLMGNSVENRKRLIDRYANLNLYLELDI